MSFQQLVLEAVNLAKQRGVRFDDADPKFRVTAKPNPKGPLKPVYKAYGTIRTNLHNGGGGNFHWSFTQDDVVNLSSKQIANYFIQVSNDNDIVGNIPLY